MIKILSLVLALLVPSIKMSAAEQNEVQLRLIINQLNQSIHTKNKDKIGLLLSSEFRVGPYGGSTAVRKLEHSIVDHDKMNLKIERTIERYGHFYVVVTGKNNYGKKLKFGIKLDKYFDITRIGLLEQLDSLPDPVLSEISPPRLLAAVPVKQYAKLLVFHAKINGRDFNFLFDSGCSKALIDSNSLQNLGMIPIASTDRVTMSNGKTEYTKKIKDLTCNIENVKIELPEVLVGNLSVASSLLGIQLDGIIGYDLLKDYAVYFTAKNSTMNIYSGHPQIKNKKNVELPVSMFKNVPLIDIVTSFNGKNHTAKIMFDTGAQGAVEFHPYFDFKTDLRLHLKDLTKGMTVDVANNHSEKITGAIDEISIGEFKRKDVRVTISDDKIEWNNYDGLLGMELLNNFDICFDYLAKKIVLVSTDKHNVPKKSRF